MAAVTINQDVAAETKARLAHEYHRVNGPVLLRLIREDQPLDTGELRESTSIDQPRFVAGEWVLRCRAKAKHARVVYKGHGVIVPKVAKALRFVTKTGKVVYAKRVRAVPGNPYFYNTFRRVGFRSIRRTE